MPACAAPGTAVAAATAAAPITARRVRAGVSIVKRDMGLLRLRGALTSLILRIPVVRHQHASPRKRGEADPPKKLCDQWRRDVENREPAAS
ncbi:hypothetical protein GALLR39Z86_25810 [Glycomyces algeriensis]|uniref:Uncharacterized protein n=1 Tax=Glycomyces algeriensis TaxID=256037 RepID=A0A9W6G997_9ACTN|nr:hypothetical protein GALLR39Z86_25810 [Glycomyces algeriensis]